MNGLIVKSAGQGLRTQMYNLLNFGALEFFNFMNFWLPIIFLHALNNSSFSWCIPSCIYTYINTIRAPCALTIVPLGYANKGNPQEFWKNKKIKKSRDESEQKQNDGKHDIPHWIIPPHGVSRNKDPRAARKRRSPNNVSRFVTSIPSPEEQIRVPWNRLHGRSVVGVGDHALIFSVEQGYPWNETDEDYENPSPPVNPARVRLIPRDYVTPQCLSGGPETLEHLCPSVLSFSKFPSACTPPSLWRECIFQTPENISQNE